MVNYPVYKSNTPNLQIPLQCVDDISNNTPNHIPDDLFWKGVGEEIEKLAKIITTVS